VTGNADLVELMHAAGRRDQARAGRLLAASPGLATARLGRDEEFFLDACHAQCYAGDTALHAAAAAYEVELARALVAAGADVRARNRRGAEPLHAAVIGMPGTRHWNPARQVAVIAALVEMGADPEAAAAGGVTPLHRAVRNRCAAAVEALLATGADPQRPNDHGSTPLMLAGLSTGRSGSGSDAAQAEQEVILRVLTAATGRASSEQPGR
jgi:ankyrin repeat protein